MIVKIRKLIPDDWLFSSAVSVPEEEDNAEQDNAQQAMKAQLQKGATSLQSQPETQSLDASHEVAEVQDELYNGNR